MGAEAASSDVESVKWKPWVYININYVWENLQKNKNPARATFHSSISAAHWVLHCSCAPGRREDKERISHSEGQMEAICSVCRWLFHAPSHLLLQGRIPSLWGGGASLRMMHVVVCLFRLDNGTTAHLGRLCLRAGEIKERNLPLRADKPGGGGTVQCCTQVEELHVLKEQSNPTSKSSFLKKKGQNMYQVKIF